MTSERLRADEAEPRRRPNGSGSEGPTASRPATSGPLASGSAQANRAGTSGPTASGTRASGRADTNGQGAGEFVISSETVGFRPHNCFVCGELNTAGLRMVFRLEGSTCVSEIVLGERFEGWEGIVHGGVVSAILDEAMGWSLIHHDSWGVTAKLDVQFRRPVRIGRAVRVEGWITESRRRTQRTAGRLVDVETGEELATAEALYVAASNERKAELKRLYGVEKQADRLRVASGEAR